MNTPITDAFAIKFKTPCGEKYWVPVDIARKLQRELDEARGQRDRLAEALKGIAGMPEYDQDDPYRLRNKAAKALQSLTPNQP